MKVETKYNVWDKVWIEVEKRPIEVCIDRIIIDEYGLTYETSYWNTSLPEEHIFQTKEELLKSL